MIFIISFGVVAGEPLIDQAGVLAPYLSRLIELTMTLFIDLHIWMVIFAVGFHVREHLCAVTDSPTVQVA
jgi:hypothetical protein